MRIDVLKANTMQWGAILGGAVVSLALCSLFNLVGVGINMVSADPEEFRPIILSGGVIFWSILGATTAMFSGGWISGRFSDANASGRIHGAVHGFLTASLATIFLFFLTEIFPVVILSDVINVVSHNGQLSKVFKDMAKMNPDFKNAFNAAVLEGENSIDFVPSEKAEEIKPKLEEKIRVFLGADSESDFQDKRKEFINFISDTFGVQQEEVEKELEKELKNIEINYNEIQEKSKKYVWEASNELGKEVFLIFLVSLLSLVSGTIGGISGKKIIVTESKNQKKYC